MKKEVSPVALVGIVIVVVVVLVAVGYKVLQPASYQLSPGAANAPKSGNAAPGNPVQSQPTGANGSTYYPAAPPGSIPGKPTVPPK